MYSLQREAIYLTDLIGMATRGDPIDIRRAPFAEWVSQVFGLYLQFYIVICATPSVLPLYRPAGELANRGEGNI